MQPASSRAHFRFYHQCHLLKALLKKRRSHTRFDETVVVPPHIFEFWILDTILISSPLCRVMLPPRFYNLQISLTLRFRVRHILMQYEDSAGCAWVEERDADNRVFFVNSNTMASLPYHAPLLPTRLLVAR